MGRAEFEENSLHWILAQSRTVVETVAASPRVLSELYGKTEQEFSVVSRELQKLKEGVSGKLARLQHARDESGRALESCKSSYEQSKRSCESKEQETQMAQFQSEIAHQQQTCGELDASLSALKRVSDSLLQMERELTASKNEFNAKKAQNGTAMQSAASDTECFYLAVENACAKAEEILGFREGCWSSQWHANKYKINRTGHEGMVRGRYASASLSEQTENFTTRQTDENADMCVTFEVKNSEDFFARLDGFGEDVPSFRIPSYDFHKIGGVKAIEELKRRGFEVKREGGSMIGNDGFITWERRK